MTDTTNRDKLRTIVNTQISKLHELAKNPKYILASNEIKSLSELAHILTDIEKLDEIKDSELDKLSTDELLGLQYFRQNGRWPK